MFTFWVIAVFILIGSLLPSIVKWASLLLYLTLNLYVTPANLCNILFTRIENIFWLETLVGAFMSCNMIFVVLMFL